MYKGVKMNKKIFILVFLFIALISMSAVSAADLDDSNETVALSEIGEGQIAVSNDVNAIDDLNKDDSGSEAVLGNAVKSSVAGEKEILGVENSGSEVLGATGTTITSVNVNVGKYGADPVLNVFGVVRDSNGEGISKGTVSVCLNDKVNRTLTPFGVMGYFSTQVILTPGSYNLVLRYHDDSGEYKDCEYVYEGNPIVIPHTWYVNGSKSSSGNGKSEAEAFVTLDEALTAANDGDKIKIAAGTYSGNGNSGVSIQKLLTFEKYGDGEAIFDGNGQSTIWSVDANSINISGLTFKNGHSNRGGAIYFLDDVSNSVINATFINNTGIEYGGAIYVGGIVSKLTLNSAFINNTATGNGANGGALYSDARVSNSVINSTFENNSASIDGGAIYFSSTVSDSLINSTFKNNSAQRGGAIRFKGTFTKSNLTSVFINNIASADGGANCFNFVNNVNIIGDFINNTAKGSGGEYGGGANAVYYIMTNVSISGNFIGNSAKGSDATDGGAANYFFNGISNVNITGKFINNTGNNVIYILKDSGNNYIQDSVFLNNEVNHIINVTDGKITANYNWFGNNLTNYKVMPENVGIDLVNWLFLLAYPQVTMEVGESSQFTFELFVFDSNLDYGYSYDASKMNITLDLSQTLGELDKTSALIGEKITYTAKKGGTATVTGKFETASNIFSFTINDSRIPTEIKIANSTVNLKANDEIESGATLNPTSAGNVTYTSSNSSVAIVKDDKIIAVGEGSANITVSFAGDNKYAAAENKTIAVNVSLNDASVSVNNDTLNLLVKDTFDLEATPVPSGLNVSYSSTNESVVTVNSEGKVTAVGAGNATIVVTVGDDKVYAINSTNVSVNVKIPTAIMDIAIPEMRVGNKFTLYYILVDSNTGWTIRENLEYTVTSTNESVVKAYINNGIVIECVGEGNANVTAGFAGNDKYAAAENKTFTLTVNKVPTEIKIANSTVDMKVKEEIESGASLTPADAGNVTYTSSNSSVAIVENGKIKALAEGSANITVSFAGDNKYATAENKTITVNVSLNDASLSVDNSTLDLFVGDYYTLTVNTSPEGLNVTFTPDNSGVVSVDENGKVTALKEGEGSVRVSVGGDGVYEFKSIDVTVTVKKIPTEISVENSTVDMKVNDEIDAGASLTPADAGNVSYTSSNSSVAVVEGGKVKALAEGSANITVSFAGDNKYATAENKTITVNVSLNEASLSVDNSTLDLFVGDYYTLTVNTVPEGLNVTFTPDNSGVVSVDENGVVTALKQGTAIVTVEVGDDKIYAKDSTTVAVTVSKIPTEIIVQNDTLDLKVGDEVDPVVSLMPSNAGNLSFVSSDESVVLVNGYGFVTAVGAGNATVTVSYMGNDKYVASQSTIAVTVSKIGTAISASDVSLAYNDPNGELLATIVDEYGNPLVVDLNVNFNGENYTVMTDSDGQATISIGTLTPGKYAATISYEGNEIYNDSTATAKVTVTKAGTVISASDVSLAYKDPNGALLATIVNEHGKALVVNLNVELNGKTYNVRTDSDGQASISLDTLTPGTYTATISYKGSSNYKASNATAQVTVTKADTVISASDVSIAYRDSSGELVATIVNEHGKALVVTLNFELNGETYTVKTDSNGQASIPIGTLTPGKYAATISYKGSVNYKASNATAKVTVTKSDTVISAPDVSIAYRDPSGELVATIVNEHGKALVVNLNVELNGKNYTVRTDSDGQASILLDTLTPGTYTATISYKGSSNYRASSTTAKVTVTKADTVISAPDVSVAYRDPSGELVAIIVNEHGKALVVNLNVELNGKNYTVRTDSDGQASILLDTLTPGTYTAKISYKGSSNYKASSTTAKVTVTKSDTVISAPDVSVAYRDPSGELVATIINEHGKPLVVNLNVELNGKNYTVRTDSDGQARIAIGTLVPGKYTATISYKGSSNYKASTTTAKVTVTKADTIISAPNVKIAYKDPSGELVATIVNEHGKPLVVNLNVNINSKDYTVRTDSNGQARIAVDTLTPGTYTATISYKGSGNYKASTATAQVKVTKAATIINAPDVSVAYNDPNGKLVSTITNEHGKPLVVNLNVDLNGKTYTARTDSNGQISVPTADLAPGTYTASISYKGSGNYKTSSTTANIQVN